MAQRVKLTIEYDGTGYAGWQRQPDQPTIQGALEHAAAQFNEAPVLIQGAGRTDAGVHATGQVAHMDMTTERPIHKIADAMNFHLRPQPVAVLKAEAVNDAFHARFSATGRAYRYVILNRRADLTLERGRALRVPYQLDADAMHRAAQCLIGVHDYTTFRDLNCQAKTPVKSIDKIAVTRFGDRVEVTVEAISFLHRQVRSITGSLIDIGRGAQPESWMQDILDAKDRTACGPVAAAEGLYLERVDYG